MSGNVIFLSRFKESRCSPEYKVRIAAMDKLELLEEMVVFQQERSRLGYFAPKMIAEGIVLFQALEDTSQTPELRSLTRSYRRNLERELEVLKNGQ